jgi:hypothetical protein
VLRKAVVLAVLAGVVLPSAAAAGRTTEQIMPDVKYIRETRQIGGAPVRFHVVIGPKPNPTGLFGLRPVLSNEKITGLETLSSMQRRLLPRANVVGVNGDLFRPDPGHPTSTFARGGVLMNRPLAGRTSLGIGLDGVLRLALLRFAGTLRFGTGPSHALKEFNRPLYDAPRGFTLFAPTWGTHTPTRRKTNEVILDNVRRTIPNADRTGRVVRVVRGSGHAIPAGGAILQARGSSRDIVRAEANAGVTMTFRLGVDNWWDGVEDAIGGGPRLVSGGVAIHHSGEWFTDDQLLSRHPRTAVGQRSSGRIILLVADGRSTTSYGLTDAQLANAMVHYGAWRATGLDGGGSSEMAFNGHVFNHPSDGHERPLADSLQLTYIGAYARKPRFAVFSPNGDGYHDVQRLHARFVRTSETHLELVRPDGVTAWHRDVLRDPGAVTKDFGGSSRMEGRWRWIVEGVDGKGRSSRMVRGFTLNKTLGFLTLSTRRMRVRAHRGGHLRIGFQLAHTADVSVRVVRRNGDVVRTLAVQSGLSAGAYAVIWNGRNDAGRVVRSGRYFVLARAKNGLGAVSIEKGVAVRRVS